MAWNRLYLKNRLKSSFFQERGVEDGLLTDALIDESINEAIKYVVDDCNLNLQPGKIPLREGVYAYVLPEDLLSVRAVWYRDDEDYRHRLTRLSVENFLDEVNPNETDSRPLYYTYPHAQGRVFHFWAGAAPIYDYIEDSYITECTIRTIVDSGVSFGSTLDGRPIEPGDLVHNLTDDSYGYVQALDITTPLATGTCTPNTSNVLIEDTSKDFNALGLQEGFIICKPSEGYVTAWATVTEWSTTYVRYKDYQDPSGKTSGFVNAQTYKIGKGTEIRISLDPPHPGMRSGGRNYFYVSDPKATITATVFDVTRCTGTGTTGAEVGDTAIASGGSHGKITAVAATYIDVNYWIGGTPADGEEVSVRECDRYQVESRFATERVIWLHPCPSGDDTIGQESLECIYSCYPALPVYDSDLIPVHEMYSRPLFDAARWQCYLMKGNTPEGALDVLERRYKASVKPLLREDHRLSTGQPITLWNNRQRRIIKGNRYTVSSGATFDASAYE